MMIQERQVQIQNYQNKLNGEGFSDTVNHENKKAESYNSAFCKYEPADSERGSCKIDNHSISHSPNLHKHKEKYVSEEGYLKLPRSFIQSERWRSLKSKQQRFFLYLLERAQYTPKTFYHNGNEIHVAAGQFCISYRRMVDEFNQTVRFKEDKIDLPFLQRVYRRFKEVQLATHQPIHDISIITITMPELSDHFKMLNDTQTDTETIHFRYTNEERKKEKKVKETIDRAVAPDRSSLFQNEKKEEKIQECRHPKTKKKSKLTEEQKKNANDVWQALQKFQMVNVHNSVIKGVTQSDVTSWVKNFTIQDIRESIKMAYDASGVKSYPAYIQKLLSAKIVQKGKDSDQGRVYVQSIIKKYELKHIELKKYYFVDLISGDQMFYYLPQHTLESFLSRSIQRAQENDECHYD